MNWSLNLLDLFLLVGFGQGLLVGIVIIGLPILRNKDVQYIGYTIILLSLIGLDGCLGIWNLQDQYYFIDFFGDDIPWILLVYVPLFIYFYRSFQRPFGFSNYRYLLAIPFVVFALINIYIDLGADLHWYEVPFTIDSPTIQGFYQLEEVVSIIFNFILAAFALRLILKQRNQVENWYWHLQLWAFPMLVLVLWVAVVAPLNWQNDFLESLGKSLLVLLVGFIYWVVYRGIINIKSALDLKPEKVEKRFTASDPKYAQLQQLFVQDRLFLNPDISRAEVAKKLGISAGYLTKIIKEAAQQNFTSYVNQFRVEEAKRLLNLPEYAHYSLTSIGLEAGFRSKSAFYDSFKKIVGQTPANYQKSTTPK